MTDNRQWDQTARAAAREDLRLRVISEIRRIAAANGGVPPGMQKFTRITGITRGECIGVVCARWADALRQAGFPPNAPNPRLNDLEMLEAFASVMRKFGHVPTESDLRIYRASGHSLPGKDAYRQHFGRKQELLLRVKQWAVEHGHADIAAMLTEIKTQVPEPADARGSVYLLQCGQEFKIGCSRTPDRRVRQLQQILPANSRLLHCIETDDPYGIECYWHRRFAPKRLKGEWFRLTPADVAAFRRRSFQ